jgi:asparagine synthase (glutamine-hydrolysing)
MCGICGYISLSENLKNRKPLIQKMKDLLTHRGPDDEGLYLNNNAALGHRRLSIIDLSTGKQPMGNDDGSIWIVYNGEVYNFPEIKDNLEKKGINFRTQSDTEVILRGYEVYGLNILDELNGMFAFAIWDEKKKRLFAARDRLGKKPFYYYCDEGKLIFASELKSIIVHPDISRDVNPEAVDKFFSFNYIPAPLTIFKNVHKLRPGHYLLWEAGELCVRQYWDVKYHSNNLYKSETDFTEHLYELLKTSVKRRLISDVPLGAFLSGGMDSSIIVGLMALVNEKPVKTFTIGFEEQGYSEVDDARMIADHFKTDHHEFRVKSEAIDMLPKLVWHFDEPFADSSAIPTYYVSKIAREHVTVILSGDGGDEMFAGYRRYINRNGYAGYRKLPRMLRERILGPLAVAAPFQMPSRNFLLEISRLEKKENFDWIEIYPYIKNELYSREFQRDVQKQDHPGSVIHYWKNMPESPLLSRLQYSDTKVYLPEDILVKVDRMSMANSLETRAPLLDYEVAEFAAGIPAEWHFKDGRAKYMLRKVAEKFLPEPIFHKKKHGFAIPANEWFRNELWEMTSDLLGSSRFHSRGYFNQRNVSKILNEHKKGARDYSTWLWCLVNFELWFQTYMDSDLRKI